MPPTPPTPPFPRTNFGANDTLIYDPMLSYSDFTKTETNPSNPDSNLVSFTTAESHLLGYFVATATTGSTRFSWSGKREVVQSQYRRHMSGRCLKVLGESFHSMPKDNCSPQCWCRMSAFSNYLWYRVHWVHHWIREGELYSHGSQPKKKINEFVDLSIWVVDCLLSIFSKWQPLLKHHHPPSNII